MHIKCVLFDIDGTISDTLPLCIQSFHQTLFEFGGRAFSEEEITAHFGKSEEGILAALLPHSSQKAYKRYCEVYEGLQRKAAQPIPGIRSLIEFLSASGYRMGVVTGRGLESSLITLSIFNLLPYMEVIETGSPTSPMKSESLKRASQRLGLQPGEIVYLGDTLTDIHSASAIGMLAAGAGWASTATLTAEQDGKAVGIFKSVEDFKNWLIEETPIV